MWAPVDGLWSRRKSYAAIAWAGQAGRAGASVCWPRRRKAVAMPHRQQTPKARSSHPGRCGVIARWFARFARPACLVHFRLLGGRGSDGPRRASTLLLRVLPSSHARLSRLRPGPPLLPGVCSVCASPGPPSSRGHLSAKSTRGDEARPPAARLHPASRRCQTSCAESDASVIAISRERGHRVTHRRCGDPLHDGGEQGGPDR